MILFVKASVGNLFHLAFCCCWDMTLFSRSLQKWEKIVKEFFFFFFFYKRQVGYVIFQTWKCSGLTVMVHFSVFTRNSLNLIVSSGRG